MCIPGLAPRKYIEKNKGKTGKLSTKITWGRVSKCAFSLAFDGTSLRGTGARGAADSGNRVTPLVLCDNRCVDLMALAGKFKHRIRSFILALVLFQNHCTANLCGTLVGRH